MQEIAGLVSVIIPAYNAEKFIADTIDSVQSQTYRQWEMIVVNDGSTDATSSIVKKKGNEKIQLIEQTNAGVSAARNKGLEQAGGEYVVFLDGDDLMTPFFLEERVSFLQQNPSFGFCGGQVENFPAKAPIRNAAANDPEKEILYFDLGYATVPSNYVFRKKILTVNTIKFNTALSSTADRFFILQVARYTKGKSLDTEKGKLLYRISENSMSHKISPALLRDNEKFYHELCRQQLLPQNNTGRFKSLYFYSLGLGFMKINYFKSATRYLFWSFISSPVNFFRLIILKIFSRK
jgi:glycosyltransferase involved in cell wall biosynthesis